MSYQGPQDQLKDPEVYREFQEVARAMKELPLFLIVYREPVRPREGMYCVCDGNFWNPLGDGVKRPIWFHGTAWVAL